MSTPASSHTNRLIHETSPYLLQHARNPVDWFPWGEEALEKAKAENKLLLISIGYSACHWCHVMEKESFENEETAAVMNAHFVCIKVDREERPDIDQIYMQAVQLMTGSGGWPLNCFALPDGRPVYGGTFFPNYRWMEILYQLSSLYVSNPDKLRRHASELTDGINKTSQIAFNTASPSFTREELSGMYRAWAKYFDNNEGGAQRTPKFPLPNNYEFLLRYFYHTKEQACLDHVNLTLTKLAMGGIYDQVGGGFARYSTDALWKVPHFEKMLYDNAQLVSLYANAFRLTNNPLYKEVVYETLNFIEREMTSTEGGFYSALDADSEGEEGKFYVWTKEELVRLIPAADRDWVFEYFSVNDDGYWEEDKYILLRKKSAVEIAEKYAIQLDVLSEKIISLKNILRGEREKRTRPGLDNKQLTAWNALMAKGYAEAWCAFGEKQFLEASVKNMRLILSKQLRSDGGLFRVYKNGRVTINGYLEDYSFVIEALLVLYECTFDTYWLTAAKNIADYTLLHFYDEKKGLCWFTSDLDKPLIVKQAEIYDNVIPSSNSSMAKNIFRLGKFYAEERYVHIAETMLNNVKPLVAHYGAGYSNWAMLMCDFIFPFYEVAVCGPDCAVQSHALLAHYLPGMVLCGAERESWLPLLQQRFPDGKTLIYVCRDQTCLLPVMHVEEAIGLMTGEPPYTDSAPNHSNPV